jgi:hypothetical protein
VWAANSIGNSVTELSAATGALIKVISGPSYGFNGPDAVFSDGTHVWVANSGGSVTELSEATGALVQVVSGSRYGFNYPAAVSSDRTDVWVTNLEGQSVTVFPTGGAVTPPTVTTAPYPVLEVGAQVGSPTTPDLPVSVSWQVSTGSSAVCATQLQRSVNGGSWTSIPVSPPTATSATDTVTAITDHYQYRVNVTDCDGGSTGWVTGNPYAYNLLQETSSQWTYSPAPAWTAAACAQCSDSSARDSTASGATATLKLFTAYEVGLVLETGPTQGSANVIVDGTPQGVVNTYAPTAGYRLVKYQTGWPTYGAHTVQLVNQATAGHPGIDIDAAALFYGP